MKRKNLPPAASVFVIDKLGGTGAVASICDISAASVSQWRSRGIPDARHQFLRLRNPEVFRRLDHDNGRNKRVQTREIGRAKEEQDR